MRYSLEFDLILQLLNIDLNIDHGEKVVRAQEKKRATHGDMRVHLPIGIGIGAHKREDTVHRHAEKALNGHRRVGAVHHKIEVEEDTAKKGIISISSISFFSRQHLNLSAYVQYLLELS